MRCKIFLSLIACALAGCPETDQTPETKPTKKTARTGDRQPSALEQRLDAAMKAGFVAAVKPQLDKDPNKPGDLVLHDLTPHLEQPDRPGPGIYWTFLRGASVYVPLKGLESVGLAATEEGHSLKLAYESLDVVIKDTSGTAAAKREVELLVAKSEGLVPLVWPKAKRETAGSGSSSEIAAYEEAIGRFDAQYKKSFSSLADLHKLALRQSLASVGGAKTPFEAFRGARLLLTKAELIKMLGSDVDGPPDLVWSGPVIGLKRGELKPGKRLRTRLVGPDGMVIAASFSVTDKPSSEADSATDVILGSLRPFAPSKGRARQIQKTLGRRAKAGGKLVEALGRISIYHHAPTPTRLTELLAALKTTGKMSAEDTKTLQAQLERFNPLIRDDEGKGPPPGKGKPREPSP